MFVGDVDILRVHKNRYLKEGDRRVNNERKVGDRKWFQSAIDGMPTTSLWMIREGVPEGNIYLLNKKGLVSECNNI